MRFLVGVVWIKNSIGFIVIRRFLFNLFFRFFSKMELSGFKSVLLFLVRERFIEFKNKFV